MRMPLLSVLYRNALRKCMFGLMRKMQTKVKKNHSSGFAIVL